MAEALGSCLSEAPIAEELFWARSFAAGAGEWARDAVYQLPAAWEGPLALLTGLAGASPDSATRTLLMLQRLPVFSEDVEGVDAADLEDAGAPDDRVPLFWPLYFR